MEVVGKGTYCGTGARLFPRHPGPVREHLDSPTIHPLIAFIVIHPRILLNHFFQGRDRTLRHKQEIRAPLNGGLSAILGVKLLRPQPQLNPIWDRISRTIAA
jgi:hypothetical protein